jgi:AraC-like DNA-binding protein
LLAARLNKGGKLSFKRGAGYSVSDIAEEGGFKTERVSEAVRVFLELDMLRESCGVLKIKNWQKYQKNEQYEKEKEKTKTLDYVERAKAYMEAGYSGKIRISELSRSLNLERTYFSALFKEKTGKSPQTYLTELRLSRGAELITRYGLSPTEASGAVGYSDLFSFSRMFKRRYGISPTEYKQNYIKRHEKSDR